MKEILYLFFALIPAVIWIIFFHKGNKGEPEPLRLLLIAFLMGALVVVPAAFIELFTTKEIVPRLFFGADKVPVAAMSYFVIISFVIVAVVEELFKFLAVRLSVYYSDYFNEYSDGIVYMVVAAFGFAVIENYLYFLKLGYEVIIPRSILTPLFHASAAAIVGHYLGAYKFNKSYKKKVFLSLVFAAVIHFIYNLLVYTYGETLNIWYMAGALLLLLLSMKWMFDKFSEAEELDAKCWFCEPKNSDTKLS